MTIKKIFSEEQILNWKDYYIEKDLSLSKIQEKTGVNRKIVSRELRKIGVYVKSSREQSTKHQLNTNYFEKIDTKEKAYWLGLIAADGNVHRTKFEITLQERDLPLLERMKEAIGSTHPIGVRKIKGKKYVRLHFSSRDFCEYLKRWGIVERKSYLLCFPSYLEEKLIRSYVLGYFDGDGGITLDKKNYPRLYFIGRKDFLEELQSKIIEDLSIGKVTILGDNRSDHVFSLNYTGNILVRKIEKWLYEDNVDCFLERKKEKFSHILKEHTTTYVRLNCPICAKIFEKTIKISHLKRDSKIKATCCSLSCSSKLMSIYKKLSLIEKENIEKYNVLHIFKKITHNKNKKEV